jgi:hypothetical protein
LFLDRKHISLYIDNIRIYVLIRYIHIYGMHVNETKKK